MIRQLPTSVFLLCKTGALLVGGAAFYLLNKTKQINDYDLIVPPEKWYLVSLLIPKNAKINKHGGIKFKDDKKNIIDIWPCSIEQHLRQCKTHIDGQEYVIDYLNNKVFTSFNIGVKNDKKILQL